MNFSFYYVRKRKNKHKHFLIFFFFFSYLVSAFLNHGKKSFIKRLYGEIVYVLKHNFNYNINTSYNVNVNKREFIYGSGQILNA